MTRILGRRTRRPKMNFLRQGFASGENDALGDSAVAFRYKTLSEDGGYVDDSGDHCDNGAVRRTQ